MSEESGESDLKKAFQESKVVESIDTPDPFEGHKLWDIVRVKDRANKPYILLGKEGEDLKFWFQFNGESRENMERYVDWKIASDKLSKDKKRTPEELDFLRRVCLSMGTLCELVTDSKEFNEFMITTIIVEVAKRWYKADNPDKEPDDNGMTIYCELVNQHIQQLTSIITGVVGTMSDKDSTPTIVGD